MRGFLIFLGFLLLLAGGAVAGAQYAPLDLATIQVLDQVPGSREFLLTQNALYAGAGAAGLGFLLIIIAAVTGGSKKLEAQAKGRGRPGLQGGVPPPPRAQPSPKPTPAPETVAPPALRQPAPPRVASAPSAAASPQQPVAPAPLTQPAAAPKASPQPMAAAVAPSPAAAPQPASAAQPLPPAPQAAAAPAPRPIQAQQPVATTPPPQPAVAAPASQPAPTPQPAAAPQATSAPAPQPAVTPEPKAKPQASAQPPAGVAAAAPQPIGAGTPPPDPRMINRKRVQDLVTINDALKAYHKKNGAYPKAEGLAGANERGAAWIPGLAPEFLAEIPRDPLHGGGTQYAYVSDGANYKLLAQGASLVGSGNVEVLGIKIDQTRNPTPQDAAFGFWTPDFAGA